MRILVVVLAIVPVIAPLAAQDTTALARAKEAALGAGLARDVMRHAAPLGDPEVSYYVDQLGARLAAHAPGELRDWRFAIVEAGDWAEPRALPGGYVFVAADMLRTAKSESEFASKLAHAIAHIAEKHGTTQHGRLMPDFAPVIYMGGFGFGGDDQIIPSTMRAMARIWESAADRVAVDMLAAAGLSSAAPNAEFERMPALATQRAPVRQSPSLRRMIRAPQP